MSRLNQISDEIATPGGMAGLVPAIHVFVLHRRKKDVDARDKRGHDADEGWFDPVEVRSKRNL